MFSANAESRPHVLLVEDNPGDARLLREALSHPELREGLQVVPDGEAAIQYLRRTGKYQNADRPWLIFLDLNLPRRDGREVLAEIKRDKDLRTIPVIVLTTSEAELDIRRTYDLHANCFITKPSDLDEYIEVIRACEKFWFDVVRLPA